MLCDLSSRENEAILVSGKIVREKLGAGHSTDEDKDTGSDLPGLGIGFFVRNANGLDALIPFHRDHFGLVTDLDLGIGKNSRPEIGRHAFGNVGSTYQEIHFLTGIAKIHGGLPCEGLRFGDQEVARFVGIVAFRDAVVDGFYETVVPVGFGGVGGGGVPISEGLAVAEVVAVGGVETCCYEIGLILTFLDT